MESLVCPGGNLCQGVATNTPLSHGPTPAGFRRSQWGPELPVDKCPRPSARVRPELRMQPRQRVRESCLRVHHRVRRLLRQRRLLRRARLALEPPV
jgi:hypothetical protein